MSFPPLMKGGVDVSCTFYTFRESFSIRFSREIQLGFDWDGVYPPHFVVSNMLIYQWIR